MIAAAVAERFGLSIGEPRDDDDAIAEPLRAARARARTRTRRRHRSAASSRRRRRLDGRPRQDGERLLPAFSATPSMPESSHRAAASATAAPTPRRTVRREIAFLVTIMIVALLNWNGVLFTIARIVDDQR